jgi:hypothetical protein
MPRIERLPVYCRICKYWHWQDKTRAANDDAVCETWRVVLCRECGRQWKGAGGHVCERLKRQAEANDAD